MRVQVIRCGPAVNASERKAGDRLKTGLISIPGNDEWRLLTNLRFSPNPNRQSDEIDVIAIGPPGVRVIEVKHWTSSWMKRNEGLVEAEAERVTDKAKRVAGKLRRTIPDLPFVQAVLLSTERRGSVKATEGRQFRGVPFHGLDAGWKEALGLGAEAHLDPQQVKGLATVLWPRAALAETGETTRLAGYSGLRLVTPPEQKSHRIYEATHSTRHDRVRLHLFDLSADVLPPESAPPREKFDAIHRLQLHAFAPRILDSLQPAPGYPGELEFFTVTDSAAKTVQKRAADPSWDTGARLRFGAKAAAALCALHDVGLRHTVTEENIRVEEADSPLLIALEEARTASGAADGSVARDVQALVTALTTLFEGRDDESSSDALKALRSRLRSPEKLTTLATSFEKLADRHSATPGPVPIRKAWTVGDEVTFEGARYRIVAHLESRDREADFKVVELEPESGEESRTFLARAALDDTLVEDLRKSGERVRSLFRREERSPVYRIASSSDSDFVLLLPWVEGEPLAEFVGLLREFAADSDTSSDALAVRWLRSVLGSLDVLHRHQLRHGEVTLHNLVLAGEDLVLIGCERSRAAENSLADDVRHLASALFEAFIGPGALSTPGAGGPHWPNGERTDHPLFAAFVDQALGTDGDAGFPDAGTALASLESEQPDEAPRQQNEVQWLRSLLSSYPGSRWGNRETRGLDSDFAAATYVETKLETSLYRDILGGRVRLVVLSGNAGDGKTALLQHLAEQLGMGRGASRQRILEGTTDDGLTVRMNLDGSAAWRKRSADDLLDEFLEPFHAGAPTQDIVHLLAINDGRLLEWIEHADPTTLTDALSDRLDDPKQTPPSYLRFIDLNDRSLVGAIPETGDELDTSFLERLVESLYGGENAAETWKPCATCSAREHCRVFEGAQWFGPGAVAGRSADERRRARERLFEAFQAAHLRGETHITVRELRSALVYILFGLHYCTDYHQNQDAPAPFWDRAFDATSHGRQGEMLGELARFDPALKSHPRIDRALGRDPADGNADPGKGETLASARRRAYFAWSSEKREALAGEDSALGLARGRHLSEFRAMWRPKGDREEIVKKRLCRGIARLDTLPPAALERSEHVPLRITPRTPTETTFWVEKPLDRFRLAPVLPPKQPGLDRLHHQAELTYHYRDSARPAEKLILGAELFHRLLDLGDGWQLGDVATDDTFAQLTIFVRRLAQEDDRRLRALNPVRDDVIYEVRVLPGADPAGRQVIELTPISFDGAPDGD